MGKPQQPELHRSDRNPPNPDRIQGLRGPRDEEGESGPVPEENEPGHHPDEEQDKPV